MNGKRAAMASASLMHESGDDPSALLLTRIVTLRPAASAATAALFATAASAMALQGSRLNQLLDQLGVFGRIVVGHAAPGWRPFDEASTAPAPSAHTTRSCRALAPAAWYDAP